MEDGVAQIEADLQKTLNVVNQDIDAIHAEKIRSDLP
jgi:hypothetical protein